ncbi:unnamed protein product [Gemmataceae bacterium]|nr:unnamed protein product [Gemmataceae bacterium]VTU01782.1 unnamed protein product [Gemmataceae bacterium]
MPIEIPDLWGDDIKVDVLPPLVILKAQDGAISRKTTGILRAEVLTSESEEPDEDGYHKVVTHTLDLTAPALNYSESVLEVSHDSDRMYPAVVSVPDPIDWHARSDSPTPLASGGVLGLMAHSRTVTAHSADEFMTFLGRALQSRYTKATIDSLLAMSNEKRMKSEAPAQAS